MEEVDRRLSLGLKAAASVEKIMHAYYQDPGLASQRKSDKSLVTIADREVEDELRKMISSVFPDDEIIGEEGEAKAGISDFSWVLDPIDGTEAFARGVPFFGTLIGVLFRGEPVCGIVNFPILSEIYFASRGNGAYWTRAGATPRLAQASSAAKLSESLFCTTSRAGFDRIKRRALFDTLIDRSAKLRGWGSCYGHMLVATGRAELMIDPDVKIWDMAAIYPIVTEAGASFTDLNGIPSVRNGSAVSCSPGIKDEVLKLISSN